MVHLTEEHVMLEAANEEFLRLDPVGEANEFLERMLDGVSFRGLFASTAEAEKARPCYAD